MTSINKITVLFKPDEAMDLALAVKLLNQRYQGMKFGQEYAHCPAAGKQGHYITGFGYLGGQAVASFALAHNLKVVKLSLLGEFTELHNRPNLFHDCAVELERWRAKYKPEVYFEPNYDFTGELLSVTYGKRNSRWSLVMTPEVMNKFKGLSLVLSLGEDRAAQAWEFFYGSKDEQEFRIASRRAFSAALNTLLGKDLFRLNLDPDIFLKREKPAPKERDYWVWLAGVAMQIVRECKKPGNNATLAEDSLSYLEKELLRQLDAAQKRVKIKV